MFRYGSNNIRDGYVASLVIVGETVSGMKQSSHLFNAVNWYAWTLSLAWSG